MELSGVPEIHRPPLKSLMPNMFSRFFALCHLPGDLFLLLALEQGELLVGERELEVLIEPGRAICGNAGVLLTKVEYTKHNGVRGFVVVDAAMNDFLRPALYEAWCDIVPLLESEPAIGKAVASAVVLIHGRMRIDECL